MFMFLQLYTNNDSKSSRIIIHMYNLSKFCQAAVVKPLYKEILFRQKNFEKELTCFQLDILSTTICEVIAKRLDAELQDISIIMHMVQ